MKKLLLLFLVLLVFPLANALTVNHTGSFTAGDSLNITINMNDTSYAGNVFWNTTSSNTLTWSKVDGDGTFSSTGDNYLQISINFHIFYRFCSLIVDTLFSRLNLKFDEISRFIP